RAECRASQIDAVGHGICYRDPIPRIEINLLYFSVTISYFEVLPWKFVRKCHMGTDQPATAGNGSDGASQLYRSGGDGTLSNAHRNHLSSKPFLLEELCLPLFGRHHATRFLRQINTGFLP